MGLIFFFFFFGGGVERKGTGREATYLQLWVRMSTMNTQI